ncbi:MAG: ABC transporter substrate-binding protein [Thermoplasmatota archaeon]
MNKAGILSFAALVLMAASFAGCLGEENAARGPGSGDDLAINVTDPLGGRVMLEEEPARIVTMTPAITETVFALGKGGLIVGIDSASNHPTEASNIEKVVSWQGLDLEKLILLEPDLVIMDKTLDMSGENYNAMKGSGFQVYRIYPLTVEEVLDSIQGIGDAIGAPGEAGSLVEDFRTRMETVKQNASSIEEEDRPRVLHVTYYDGSSDPWVATDSTFSGSLIEMGGGICAFSDDTGFGVQVSLERIIASDPDLILCSQSSTWPTQTREVILSDSNWQDITAVKEGAVQYVEGDWCDRTGPRLILGLEEFHTRIAASAGGQ